MLSTTRRLHFLRPLSLCTADGVMYTTRCDSTQHVSAATENMSVMTGMVMEQQVARYEVGKCDHKDFGLMLKHTYQRGRSLHATPTLPNVSVVESARTYCLVPRHVT